MNKFRNLFAAISFVLLAFNASAVSTIPLMISEDYPLRVGGAVREASTYAPLALTELSGILGVSYGFGGGFEGGFQIRGGALSDALFKTGTPSNWFLGGDAILRYLGNVSEVFYLGLQGRFGYAYKFGQATITQASNLTAAVGVPFGLMYGQSWGIYLMPELEFGGQEDVLDEVFGKLVGLGGAVGAYVNVGPWLYVEVKPKTMNLSPPRNLFAIDAVLGLAFDM